ncbi:uncharacterized protein LOC130440680 [Diorhabda sublineata]|uniref:uncharacterized protein LOC130440680 n=1 Tax=Diorhabda sublineata TaxID=1163346 RepID=UPI0024E0E05C|nr:uncharacterized protein LOC130440680 [Diorhabda sublineata]
MSDLSDDEPFEDSGFEYLPSSPDRDSESDDSLTSILEGEDHVATILGNFTVVADPFSDKRVTTTVPFSGDYEGNRTREHERSCKLFGRMNVQEGTSWRLVPKKSTVSFGMMSQFRRCIFFFR